MVISLNASVLSWGGSDKERFSHLTVNEERTRTEKYKCGPLQSWPTAAARPLAAIEVASTRPMIEIKSRFLIEGIDEEVKEPTFVEFTVCLLLFARYICSKQMF